MAEPRPLLRVATILTMFCILFHRSSLAPALPAPAGTLCITRERDALLDFKAGLTDPGNNLSSWRGADCCLWTGVVCSNRTGHVVTLQINSYHANMSMRVGGEIRSSLLTLRHLKHLDLSDNDFGGKPIPEFIGALGSLTELSLSNSNFGGRIPPHLGNLSNLVSLYLCNDDNPLISYSPDFAWVSRLRKLHDLYFSDIDFSAAVDWAHAINMLPNLILLALYNCGLRSTMPAPLQSNLTSLEVLELGSNPFNTSMGAILVWDLSSLQVLILSSCGIHGLIPDILGNWTSLNRIYLNGNHFTGTDTVPLTFKKLKKLTTIQLVDNFMDMDVAELLRRLPSDVLEDLTLENNNLTGSLPAWIGQFSSLSTINLSYNKLSGEIPVGIRELADLTILLLSSNNLLGTITEDDHFLFGGLQLGMLDISSNQLIGPIPTLPKNLSANHPYGLSSMGWAHL